MDAHQHLHDHGGGRSGGHDHGAHGHVRGHGAHGHHAHGPGGHHDHAAGAPASRVAIALALNLAVLALELVGAWWFSSLALLSDAAHMFTDAAALAIALAALGLARRPADDRRTFGYRRFEILAAAFNAVLLVLVAVVVLVEGIRRFFDPAPVDATGMLLIAIAGLVANIVGMAVLAGGRGDSMAVRGAYLEVWADALGSIGVIAGAVAIRVTGAAWIDPLVGIAIALWVLPRTIALLRDTTQVLLEGVPAGLSLDEVRGALAAIDGVAGVHDLHLWSLSGSDASLTAHVEVTHDADPDRVRGRLTSLLADRFGVTHVTLQTECGPCPQRGHVHP